MSKSAKSPRPKHSSTSTERKPALSIIKDIQPDTGAGQTRRQYTAEEKIHIVLEGLQGDNRMGNLV
ncbi:hypothetical protein [Spirosoma endbachense]|uniref:Transposase n=1 Tax=Spirosoma endbachense TaxID=2666025 RepID=A0A6P1W268_9BACT|nr:hypothetical protein GJR95_28345 [Spirosoma endbachense]